MCQDARAVPNAQCTKDKCKLAFFCCCMNSLMRGSRKDSRGKWLSCVSVQDPGSKTLVTPVAGWCFLILFLQGKSTYCIDSYLFVLNFSTYFLILRENCLVKCWEACLSISLFKVQIGCKTLLSIHRVDVPPKFLDLQALQVFFYMKVGFGNFHQSLLN